MLICRSHQLHLFFYLPARLGESVLRITRAHLAECQLVVRRYAASWFISYDSLHTIYTSYYSSYYSACTWTYETSNAQSLAARAQNVIAQASRPGAHQMFYFIHEFQIHHPPTDILNISLTHSHHPIDTHNTYANRQSQKRRFDEYFAVSFSCVCAFGVGVFGVVEWLCCACASNFLGMVKRDFPLLT